MTNLTKLVYSVFTYILILTTMTMPIFVIFKAEWVLTINLIYLHTYAIFMIMAIKLIVDKE